MGLRQIGIESNGLGELVARSGEVGSLELGAAEHQMRFGGLAIAQNAIHEILAFRQLVVADESRAQKVGNRKILWVLALRRPQYANHLLVLAHSQIAVAQ